MYIKKKKINVKPQSLKKKSLLTLLPSAKDCEAY